MKNLTLILFWLFTLTCCHQTRENSLAEEKKMMPIQRSNKFDNKEVPENILTLNTQPMSEATQENIDGNLFGKFFCDRAWFYVIKNPQNKIYSSHPESITLSYLDGELRKVKYIFKSDISRILLDKLGSFKIKGLDFKNRRIISNRQIINKTERCIILNSKLDNYQLTWEFGGKEIKYRVNVDAKEKFLYVEKTKKFEKDFKVIEKYCI